MSQDADHEIAAMLRAPKRKPVPYAEVLKAWADGETVQWTQPESLGWMDWESTCPPTIQLKRQAWRIKPKTVRYRVALMGEGSDHWTESFHTEGGHEFIRHSAAFIRWLTDWQEVEV